METVSKSKILTSTPPPPATPLNSSDDTSANTEITTPTNLSSNTILPLLKYMVLSDAVIQEHRKLLSFFIKLFVISSLAALADGLWIEFSENRTTFTGFLLRTGTYTTFPLHYAVIVNGIMGLICSIVCTISLVRITHGSVWLTVTICVLCGIWTTFTLVYNFGSNIIYDNQLEEIMIHELQKSSSSVSISPIWRTSQNFFKCCGIYSFKDWRFGKGQQESSSVAYPPSCCDPAKLKIGFSCGESPHHKSHPWLEGCLESESLQTMIIAYTALLISILQFLFMTFTLMMLVKVYCRRRCLKKQAIAILAAETVSNNGSTTTEDKNNVELLIQGGERVSDKDKDFELHEINKSSTM